MPVEPEAKPQLELNCAAGSPANPGDPSHLADSSSSAALAAGTACQQGLSSAFHSAEVCLSERTKCCTMGYGFQNNNNKKSVIPDQQCCLWFSFLPVTILSVCIYEKPVGRPRPKWRPLLNNDTLCENFCKILLHFR